MMSCNSSQVINVADEWRTIFVKKMAEFLQLIILLILNIPKLVPSEMTLRTMFLVVFSIIPSRYILQSSDDAQAPALFWKLVSTNFHRNWSERKYMYYVHIDMIHRLWSGHTLDVAPGMNVALPLEIFHITILILFYTNLGIVVIYIFLFSSKCFKNQ